MSECRLVFGGLELTDPLGPYVVHGEGADLGNPVPVVVAMERMLQDGAVASTLRNDNRTQKFFVTVKGADGLSLAENERALVLETGKRNTLSWTPPDGYAPTTVFDVQTSHLDNSFDDLGELRGERVYGLTITALPFGRSVDPVVTAAVTSAATPSTVLVDNCDATTGWTAVNAGGTSQPISVDTVTYATATGSLKTSAQATTTTGDAIQAEATFIRAGTVDMSAEQYLTVQYKPVGNGLRHELYVIADGVELLTVSDQTMAGGWVRRTSFCPDASVAEFRFRQRVSGTPNVELNNYDLRVDDVNRTNVATGSTPRQSLRTIAVSGSCRTEGSLSVAKSGTALGETLVYTAPALGNGYRPNLRRWRTAGGTVTTSAARVSGASEPLGVNLTDSNALAFTAPASMFRPGAYALMAYVQPGQTGVRTLSADAATMFGATQVAPPDKVSSRINFATTGYQMVQVGVLHLHPTLVPDGSSASVRVRMAVDAATVTIDEAWLFDLDGALTHVDCGTTAPAAGAASSRLWIDAPTVTQPLGGVWMGTLADKSDVRAAGQSQRVLGVHEFTPPSEVVFVVTSNADNPDVAMEHYPRWHTNAAS